MYCARGVSETSRHRTAEAQDLLCRDPPDPRAKRMILPYPAQRTQTTTDEVSGYGRAVPGLAVRCLG